MHTCVIWSGFGWLSAAIYQAQAGKKVTIVEKNSQLGGRARVLEDQWFRRDMGPSRYLMPDLFESIFADWGIDIHRELDIHKLDPSYRVFRPETDTQQDFYPRIEANKTFLESIEPWSYKKFEAFLKEAKVRYDIAIDHLLSIPYEKFTQLLAPNTIQKVLRVHPFHKLRSEVKTVFKDQRLQQILEYTMVFLGMAPTSSPAMYSMMAHVDFWLGVRYPQWGIRAVIEVMITQAKKLGVSFVTGFDVDQILIVDWLAAWVVNTTWEIIQADTVISNADLPYTEMHMLPTQYQTYPTSYRQKKTLAPSTFLLYLGIKGKISNLEHHSLIFRQHRDEVFKEINSWVIPTKPSVYICCPSHTDTWVAPEWHENLFVLVPTPARVYFDKATEQSFRDQTIALIEETIWETFADRIVVEHRYHAEHFEADYHSYKGTALWLGHTLRQSAYRRPHMQSQKVSNLYYVWWWTQPGIGMPMCMMSGKLVSEKIG